MMRRFVIEIEDGEDISITYRFAMRVMELLDEGGWLPEECFREEVYSKPKERELRWVIFECGHKRKLWFFSDEPPMEEALCLGPTCDPYKTKLITSSFLAEED